jgi:hypothetical protein
MLEIEGKYNKAVVFTDNIDEASKNWDVLLERL